MARRQHLEAMLWLWASFSLSQIGSLATAVTTSTVYYRQQQHGPIIAWDSRDDSKRELEDSDTYPRFVGMALHRPSRRVFWSDSRVIKSASIDPAGSVNVDARVLLGGLVRVAWVGANFGSSSALPFHLQDGHALQLTVKGTQCVSVLHHSSDRVECLVAVPGRIPFVPKPLTPSTSSIVTEDDCTIRTAHGSMTGVALNYYEMLAEGYLSPLVERIEIDARYVLPHALAFDSTGTTADQQQWLYWSNSADGRIYRSSLTSTAIEVLQEQRWGVRGLSVATMAVSAESTATTTVFYSQETKGTISALRLDSPSPSKVGNPTNRILIRGLHNPRGLAIDVASTLTPTLTLFFTEKTGRIYKVQLPQQTSGASMLLPGVRAAFPEDSSINADSERGATVQRMLTLPTTTRLDGIAVDSRFIYWCETNANVLARAPLDTFRRQVLVGGSANSLLSWPRSIALLSDDSDINSVQDGLLYSEYLGRVSQGSRQFTVVNELRAASLVFLDHQIQSAAEQGDGSHRHMYALE